MFTLRDFKSPETLDEAYELLMKSKMNKILGGCHFLKAGCRSYNVGIDLSKLDLNYINVEDDEIKIGATTTYRDLEYNDFLKEFCDGIIPKSLKRIVSTQLRNTAQVGASVFSRYAFSDFLPILLLLDAKVRLYNNGVMSVEEFLNSDIKKDILVEVIIPNKDIHCVQIVQRLCCKDFPIAIVSISKIDEKYKVVFGARPQKAMIMRGVSDEINTNGFDREKTLELIDEYIGSNNKAKKKYRKLLFVGLLEKALGELQ